MKQTAVEWLYDQLEFDDSISMETIHNLFEQANEIFEQQIKDAYQTSHISMMTADQYYNEKFKNK
jgi:hypothetical protein